MVRNFRLHAPDHETALAAAISKVPDATQIKVWFVFGDWWEVAALEVRIEDDGKPKDDIKEHLNF